MSKLPDFRIEVYLGEWEFKARHYLTGSDAQSMTLDQLLAQANDDERARWEQTWLGYVPIEGTAELRRGIAETYDAIGSDDVLCFAGAQEGLYCAMHALLETDDHAIVTLPCYQSLESVPRTICAVDGVVLREDRGWSLDVEEVRSKLRPNTKLIGVNFPNNPTGAIADRATFDALVDLCREREIYLFSDEVYRGIEHDQGKRLPQAADLYERALSLNVLSKAYGLPGLRIGWIATRDRVARSRMTRVKHYLSICNSAPAEVLGSVALRARSRILERNRAIAVENMRTLTAFFARFADRFEWYEPDGGCIAYPRYLGGDGVEHFTQDLLESAGVLLTPASIFASDLATVPADRFRIGFGRSGIDEALAAFERYLTATVTQPG